MSACPPVRRHVWVHVPRLCCPVEESPLHAWENCLPSLTGAWQERQLSNLGYLLHLNRLTGRRWGDRCFHPLVPWVLDMTTSPTGGMQVCSGPERLLR